MSETFILKNTTSSSVVVDDLGLILPAEASANISYNDIDTAFASNTLDSYLNDGTLILNNGSDLSYAQAKIFLTAGPDVSGYASLSHTHLKSSITDFTHTHDDLYFTKSQVTSTLGSYYTQTQANSLLAAKSDISHLHDDRYYTKIQLQTSGSALVAWGNLASVPAAFIPTEHTHDDRYFTESEVTSLLAGKSDTTHLHDSRYYTQTQMQTSGAAQMHWGNITNKPTFGGNNWLLPIKSKYTGNSAPSSTAGFAEGDRILWYSGTGANGHVYTLTSGTWADSHTPLQNDTVMVQNDGDEKPAQYWYGTSWIKIADPDYADHGSLGGLADDDHTQYLTAARHSAITSNPHNTTITQVVASDTSISWTLAQLATLLNNSDVTLHTHDSRYYTKTLLDAGQLNTLYYTKIQLQTSGSSAVAWGNLTSVPATFAPSAHTQTVSTISDISTYYYSKTQLQTSGSSAVAWGNLTSVPTTFTPSSHAHTVSDISDIAASYYTKAQCDANFAVVSHTHTTFYTKAEVDSLISSITYATISANDPATDITAAELESLSNGSNCDGLHTHSGTGSGSATLDSAYGTYGGGRIVTVDYGPVQLNAVSGFAPLRLTPITYTPSLWLSGGELCVIDGTLFIYDITRSRWLSAAANSFSGSINSATASGYMYSDGIIQASNLGYSMPYNGTVVGATISNTNCSASGELQIMHDGVKITSLWFNGLSSYSNTLCADFNAGDVLQLYVSATGTQRPSKPIASLFVKRRA